MTLPPPTVHKSSKACGAKSLRELREESQTVAEVSVFGMTQEPCFCCRRAVLRALAVSPERARLEPRRLSERIYAIRNPKLGAASLDRAATWIAN